jgi:protein-tyrosine phosphatase
LCDLVKAGYEPLLVHPEQYVYIQKHPEIIAEMKHYGCKIQICAQALFKPLWSIERKTVKKILHMGWVDYIASDARCASDYLIMRHAVRRLKRHLTKKGTGIAYMRSFPSAF